MQKSWCILFVLLRYIEICVLQLVQSLLIFTLGFVFIKLGLTFIGKNYSQNIACNSLVCLDRQQLRKYVVGI